MDLQEVLEFFDGGLFAEEYRGDLALIRSRIDDLQREADIQPPETSDLQAKVLLLRAILSLLIGDNAEASNLLFRICEPLGGFAQSWQLRSFAYLSLVIAWSRFPPILRFRAEVGSFAGELFAIQSGYAKNTQKIRDTLLQRFADGTETHQFERKMLLIFSSISLNMHIDTALHPSYPSNRSQSDATNRHDWSELVLSLQLEASASKCPKIERYLSRILLQVDIVRGASDLDDKFNYLINKCSSAQDWAGLASIYVLNADRILSPPFSSPLSLNLIAIDSANATIRNTQWDAVEASIWLNDDAKAQNHYARAIKYFEQTQAFRGCAAVHLRRGCIKHANALKATIKSSEWRNEIHAADYHLTKARELFGQDTQNQWLVSTHMIMLDITSGRAQDLVSRARLIGLSAVQNGNPIMAQFCGLLMMRFGQRQWLDYSRSKIAFWSYECALGFFESLQNQYLTFLATTSQLELYTILSNHAQSRALAEKVVPQFRGLLALFRSVKYESSYNDLISGVVANLVIDFSPHVFRSYYYARDLSAMRRWREEIKLLENDTTLKLGSRLDRPEITDFLHRHGCQAENFSAVEHQRQEDMDRIYQYYVADIESQVAFEGFDVDKAEDILKCLQVQFSYKEHTVNDSLEMVDLLLINTYNRLGDHEQARQALGRIPDAILLNETVKQANSSDYTWSRKLPSLYVWSPASAENALGLSVQAQHWAKAERVMKRIQSASSSFLDIKSLDRDGDMWHRLLYAGLLAENLKTSEEALHLLLSSADVAEKRRQSTAGEDARRGSYFTSDSGELFQALTRVALRLAAFNESSPCESPLSEKFALVGKTWSEQALIFMEQGKARALLDSMLATRSRLETEGLNSAGSWLYKKRLYFDLLAIPAETRSDSETAELQTLEADLKRFGDLTSELQSSDLLFDAATQPQTKLEAHYSCIPQDAAVIEFGFSQQGLIVFCLASSGIRSIWQSKMTFVEARRVVFRYLTEVATQPLHRSADHTRKLAALSRQLSDELLAPVVKDIRDKSHVIFVPSQPALVFPFSALLYEGKPLFLSKAVSQAPSLATLSNLVRNSRIVVAPILSALAKPGSMKAGAKEAPLKMAGIEALTLGQTFGRAPMDVKNMSSDKFKDILSNSDIVHLSTHGHTDPRSPWQAWISLRDRFRVVDLTSVSCRASMVFFGACLSGLGKATIGNDVTGFSHSMLSSGALVYLGALWRVDDISTMLLVVIFYRDIAKSAGDIPVAEYWRRAQVSLYNKSLEEVKELIDDVLRGLDAAQAAGLEPEKFVKKGRAHLRNARDHLEMDPRDPFSWAPFIVVGNGDLRFDMRAEPKPA